MIKVTDGTFDLDYYAPGSVASRAADAR